jgi:hypothetical protein
MTSRFEKPEKQQAERVKRQVYCAASGCRNLGTMSHAAAGFDSQGREFRHNWFCPDHFVAPEVPANHVPRRQYEKPGYLVAREEREQAMRQRMQADLGPGALPYEEEQWWRAQYRTLAQEFGKSVARTGRS